MNINKLNDAWITAGQKVSDLDNKLAIQAMSDDFKPDDSFNAQIIVNTLMNVLLMSVVLTVVGTWIGTLRISMDPITHFFYKWPRNFAISFAVEALIAQPIARTVLYHKHLREDAKESD